MTAAEAPNLTMALLELKDEIDKVQAWADAFKAIGHGPMIQPDAILVMGSALDTLAGVLVDRFVTVEAMHEEEANRVASVLRGAADART